MIRTDKTFLFAAAGLALAAAPPQAATPTASPLPPRAEQRVVDLAICLDTSGSMDGLIDAARQSIWAIVNDLALAKPAPKMRVALLTFGNDGHASENGWVALDVPFTEDLDLLSQKLFALTTNGGTELVGRVVKASVDKLAWSPDPTTLKMIVVAGNESADQDQEVHFQDACKHAIGKGIIVNSIYCGDQNDTIAPAWRDVAKLADGRFHAIDKDHGMVVIQTPFDEQLRVLSAKLNETYVPYGKHGAAACENQTAQDKNAESCNPQVVAQRATWKSTAGYSNEAWDLVDAVRTEKVKLAELKAEELPEAMRAMTLEQRQQHVAALQQTRGTLQAEVLGLTQKREAAVATEMKARALDASKGFDYAMRMTVREQAQQKGIAVQELPAGSTPEPKVLPQPPKKPDDC